MNEGRFSFYRIAFRLSLVLMAVAMALGLYEIVVERETPPSLVFQNIAEIEQLMESGRHDDAIARLNMTLALFPSDRHLIHNLLGNAYTALGDQESAIRHYRRALEYEPGLAEAHNNLGVALARADRRNEAIAELNRAIELRQDYAEARANLKRVLAADRRLDDSPGDSTTSPSLGRARGYLTLLFDGQIDAFRQRFTAEFASRTSTADLVSIRARIAEQHGAEVEILGERVIENADYDVYIRVSRFSATPELVEWTLVLDDVGSIVDMRIRLGEGRSP